MPSQLTPLQKDFLEAFFRHEKDFFLTGGGALAGFHLGHRATHDLDLFTTSDRLAAGEAALRRAAADLGASLEEIQTAPEFRRRLVRRGQEVVLVDLVFERVSQINSEKPFVGNIRVDPPEEILANKLCALLARAEIRDLVDVCALEGAGFQIEGALAAAARKDAGLTPAQLGWVLSQISIGDDARIPGGVTVAKLRTYLTQLQARLARQAFPS